MAFGYLDNQPVAMTPLYRSFRTSTSHNSMLLTTEAAGKLDLVCQKITSTEESAGFNKIQREGAVAHDNAWPP